MSLKDKVKSTEKQFGMGGDIFKFPDGDTRIRVLAEPEVYSNIMEGKTSAQWLGYVLVRGTSRDEDKITLAFLPHGIVKFLGNLEDDPDYGFKSYPMPYDLKISATGSGLKRKYEKVPLPQNPALALTAKQLADIAELKPAIEVAQRLEKKAVENYRPTAQPGSPQAQRSQAEVSQMYIAIETSINNATAPEKLAGAADMIKTCETSGSIDSFGAQMLRDILQNKFAALTGAPVEAINVEDIPF